MKHYDKNKESSYLKYWGDVNNLYSWAMSQKLPVNNFEWIEDTSQFNEDFIKSYNEESEEILKIYIILTMIYLFCLTEWKLKKSKNF